jgi:hypothetical protein
MPPEAIGIAGTLYVYRDRVCIVAGRFSVCHERKFQRGQGSTLPYHRAALVAAVSGKRAKRYLKRQQFLDLGEPALAYLTEIVHRRPKEWIRDVDRLHDLLQLHGPERLCAAFEQGLQEQIFGSTYVARALELKELPTAEGLIQ